MTLHAVLDSIKRQQLENPGRFLFRGQRCRYPTVTPTLHRMKNTSRGQAYTILRRLIGQARSQILPSEIRGMISATPEETIALLQHLGWPTPYIDLTDDPEVAFFFACNGYIADDGAAELLVIDREALPLGLVLVAHDDVVDPSLNLRWTRQRGYALQAPGWPEIEDSRKVDLLRMNCTVIHPFEPRTEDIEWSLHMRERFYEENSEISEQLSFVVHSIADTCGFAQLAEDLKAFPY